MKTTLNNRRNEAGFFIILFPLAALPFIAIFWAIGKMLSPSAWRELGKGGAIALLSSLVIFMGVVLLFARQMPETPVAQPTPGYVMPIAESHVFNYVFFGELETGKDFYFSTDQDRKYLWVKTSVSGASNTVNGIVRAYIAPDVCVK